jgi:hypothetical protein
MKRKQIVLGVILSVFLLLVTPALGTILQKKNQTSTTKLKQDLVDQKELLFQTILDISNNKEIQKLLLNSNIGKEGFFNPGVRTSLPIPHMLTKKELNTAYHIGLILSKTFSASKIHSMTERFQVNNQGIQNEINAVIEKDTLINREMTQLSDLKCDCGNDNTTSWTFPVLCTLLFPLVIFLIVITILSHQVIPLIEILMNIGLKLHCFWYLGPLET